MEDFLRSCVERYRELTGVQYFRKATTPFLPDASTPDLAAPIMRRLPGRRKSS